MAALASGAQIVCDTDGLEGTDHMHAMTIRFDDGDTITCSCKAIMDGKEMAEHPTTLKRVKS